MTFTIENLKTGMRVQLHPACAYWMAGARFGDIIKIGRKNIRVKLDRIDTPVSVPVGYIYEIVE